MPLNYDDPNQQQGLRQYQYCLALIQRTEAEGRRAHPDTYDFVQRMQNWAQSSFNSQELAHLNQTVNQMRPSWDEQVRQDIGAGQHREAQQRYAADQQMRQRQQYDQMKAQEIRNRSLTKTIAKGGLTVEETAKLRRDGTITRKGKAAVNQGTFDRSLKQKTRAISKNGLDYRAYLDAMEHIHTKEPGSKEWGLAVAAHGLIDGPALLEAAQDWEATGSEQISEMRLMFKGTDDETIEADDSALMRLDITEAWLEKDPELARPVGGWDEDWIGDRGEDAPDNARADFADAWDKHDGDMYEYDDVVEATGT